MFKLNFSLPNQILNLFSFYFYKVKSHFCKMAVGKKERQSFCESMTIRRYNCLLRRCRKAFFSLLFWAIFSCLILSVILFSWSGNKRLRKYLKGDDVPIDLSDNYFPRRGANFSGDFLIDNGKCRIPDIELWSPEARALFKVYPTPTCNESAKVTEIKDNALVINEDELSKLGYKLKEVECCYREILRISQSLQNFTREEADNQWRFSDECYRMDKVTKPKSSFIKVTCTADSMIQMRSTIYEQFHAIAVLPEANNSSGDENDLPSKLAFWENRRRNGNNELPPNVLFFAIDSTSRLNFHRLMHRTMNVLQNDIDAIEMEGFAKVGENTFPNFVVHLFGITEREMTTVCYPNRWKPLDDCPFIWKDFAKNKYLTAHLEDSPKMAVFNYLKTGFVTQPVDVYMRPFMMAAYQQKGIYDYLIDCLGYQRPENAIVDFVVDLATQAKDKIPYFMVAWLTDISHDDMYSVMVIDDYLSEALTKLKGNGLLDNTILFFLSDHGYRYLKIRTTKTGWYEDKLPAMWVKLPPTVEQAQPNWTTSLKENSRQIVTPFDIHYAFRDILKAFPVEGGRVDDGLPEHLKDRLETRAISPFQKVPARTCEEAGITYGYCPCPTPVEYDNSTFITLAAKAFLKFVNDQLPPICSQLRVANVFSFGTIDSEYLSLEGNESISHLDYPKISVMAVKLVPGDFLYEVWFKYDHESSNFTDIFDITRMTPLDGSGSCVSVNGFMEVEKYCYCKPRFSLLSLLGPLGRR